MAAEPGQCPRRGVGYTLVRYGIERLLYRLSVSAHAEQFVLKGTTLFTLWEGSPQRATRDLDLLGFGDGSVERVAGVFRDLCAIEVPEDGLAFAPASVRAEPSRTIQEYGVADRPTDPRRRTRFEPPRPDPPP